MKSLVTYYSRSNITKKLAEKIAGKTNSDIEEIISNVKYEGKIGYARAGKDAMTEKIIDIKSLKFDPAEYDMVYIGTPVWAGKAASPVLTYLKMNEGKFTNVKFFATAGSSGFESTFKQMEKKSVKPLKTLSLTTKQVKNDDYDLDSFIE
jgi:flavodoxin